MMQFILLWCLSKFETKLSSFSSILIQIRKSFFSYLEKVNEESHVDNRIIN